MKIRSSIFTTKYNLINGETVRGFSDLLRGFFSKDENALWKWIKCYTIRKKFKLMRHSRFFLDIFFSFSFCFFVTCALIIFMRELQWCRSHSKNRPVFIFISMYDIHTSNSSVIFELFTTVLVKYHFIMSCICIQCYFITQIKTRLNFRTFRLF